jgi:tRNA threonylcarbamoyladenosine biosynthesis protein TsaE
VVHLIHVLSRSPEETRDLGKRLGSAVSAGDVVALVGDLGSGKSVLARGILEALGVQGEMASPSFVIVASYKGKIPVHHIDLYRLQRGEALDIGLEELLYSDHVSIVEWADRLEGMLPPAGIAIEIKGVGQPDHRLISIRAASAQANARLADLAGTLVRFGVQ